MRRIFVLVVLAALATDVWGQKPEVIYHVFQRSFFDSDGDGHGDLKGMEQKLDYLQELGVTSILLMPLYQSEFYHNYFASDFREIDPEFGGMDEYLSLVREVHRRGMKIYQDVEMQYVTQDHEWYRKSLGDPSSEYANYVFYDDQENRKPWYFWGVEEFTLYDNSKHKIAVVNMNDEGVKEYTRDLLAFWMDPNGDGKFDDGVDGFRLDHMMDDLDHAGKLTNLFENFWVPVLSDLKTVNPAVRIIAEQANWGSFGYEYYKNASTDMVFAFRLKFAIDSFDKKQIMAAADSTFGFLPPDKDQIVFIENHDTRRFASWVEKSPEKMKLGASLNLLMGGVPLIYYGQEIGMPGEQLKGPTDGNDIPIREAFEWYKSAEGPGMCFWYKGTGEWWDKSNVRSDDGISVEEQRADRESLWNYYRNLIRLRAKHEALGRGGYASVDNPNDQVLTFLRSHGGEKVLVVANLSGDAQETVVRAGGKGTKAKALWGARSVSNDSGLLSLALAPWEVRVIEIVHR